MELKLEDLAAISRFKRQGTAHAQVLPQSFRTRGQHPSLAGPVRAKLGQIRGLVGTGWLQQIAGSSSTGRFFPLAVLLGGVERGGEHGVVRGG